MKTIHEMMKALPCACSADKTFFASALACTFAGELDAWACPTIEISAISALLCSVLLMQRQSGHDFLSDTASPLLQTGVLLCRDPPI